jgi:hypothetical protein
MLENPETAGNPDDTGPRAASSGDRPEAAIPVRRHEAESPPIQRSLSDPFFEERAAAAPVIGPDQGLVGAEVVGSDGTRIGTVKEVRQSDFLVDRPAKRDVYIAFGDIQELAGNQLVLKLAADDLDRLRLATPPLL